MQSPISSNDPKAMEQVAAHGADHHEEHPDHRMLGFTLFLISEGMLFVGLFVAYLTFRAGATAWPPPNTPELAKLWPTIFTIILVSSSGTIILAEHFLKHGDQNKFRLFWLITFLMGAIFIAGQAFEWNTLINHEHLTLKSGLYGGTFFLLTGFHGMHVIVGLLLQLIVFVRAFKKDRYTPEKHFGVGASSLYWHFVDIVWIFLFGLLYVV